MDTVASSHQIFDLSLLSDVHMYAANERHVGTNESGSRLLVEAIGTIKYEAMKWQNLVSRHDQQREVKSVKYVQTADLISY